MSRRVMSLTALAVSFCIAVGSAGCSSTPEGGDDGGGGEVDGGGTDGGGASDGGGGSGEIPEGPPLAGTWTRDDGLVLEVVDDGRKIEGQFQPGADGAPAYDSYEISLERTSDGIAGVAFWQNGEVNGQTKWEISLDGDETILARCEYVDVDPGDANRVVHRGWRERKIDLVRPPEPEPPVDTGDGGTDAGDGGTDAGDGGTDAGDGGTDAGDGGTDAGDGGTDAGDGGTDMAGGGGTDTGDGGTDAGDGGTDTGGGAATDGGGGGVDVTDGGEASADDMSAMIDVDDWGRAFFDALKSGQKGRMKGFMLAQPDCVVLLGDGDGPAMAENISLTFDETIDEILGNHGGIASGSFKEFRHGDPEKLDAGEEGLVTDARAVWDAELVYEADGEEKIFPVFNLLEVDGRWKAVQLLPPE